ncbi:hypothetical protein BH11PLA2_BH11PLA2_15490 [soil metagenome]
MLVALLPAAAMACMWDYDTLIQERSRFPSTLELITGKFLRHSPEFYQWRIRDRLEKLKASPNDPALYDDLAVAYEKTGQHAKAIETMLAKEKLFPGLYETYSNLGTFHILAGDFELGLPLIDKALAINPEAHFGREKYQKWLVEYALSKHLDESLYFPLRSEDDPRTEYAPKFSDFLARKFGQQSLTLLQVQNAIQAVLGMMRFADHDNPLLLEALGDLLLNDERPANDAKALAARCYLKASYDKRFFVNGDAYRKLAEHALTMQLPYGHNDNQKLALVESTFKTELEDADAWFAELNAKEAEWIRSGLNADVEFDKLYSTEPQALGRITETTTDVLRRWSLTFEFQAGFACFVFTLFVSLTSLWLIRRLVRRRRRIRLSQS